MQIYFRKSFLKQYGKLSHSDRKNVDDALRVFEKDPHDKRLKNHALRGRLTGKRAFSAGFDLRIVFSMEGDYVTVIMIGVGSHNQVY